MTATKIFARAADGDRQLLVYEMAFAAADDVAMILPLPVPPRSPEDAVRFIALDHFRDFFAHLDRGWPLARKGGFFPQALGLAANALAVVEVGDFEASFVPSLADFDRLDARFRLSDRVWKERPDYRDFGFAVFKLKAGRRAVHPMAFAFPRRDPSKIFFPTVHVHDGKVHRKARFDHTLYAQGEPPRGWESTFEPAGAFVTGDDRGVVDRAARVHRVELRGKHANEDIYV